MEGADDAGAMDATGAQSIDTTCRSPVQGTIVVKRSQEFAVELGLGAHRSPDSVKSDRGSDWRI